MENGTNTYPYIVTHGKWDLLINNKLPFKAILFGHIMAPDSSTSKIQKVHCVDISIL